LISRGAAQQHLKDILESTAAIAFMGTPHFGSNKADWGMPMARFSSLLRKTNREIVKILKPGSKMLAHLQQDFHTMLDDRYKNQQKKLEIFCFYEELPMDVIGKASCRTENSRISFIANSAFADRFG
jgi:protein SERAC1